MPKIIVIYEVPRNEHNEDAVAVLEVKDISTIQIAKAIKEYGIAHWVDKDMQIYVVKEEIDPSLIQALIKTL